MLSKHLILYNKYLNNKTAELVPSFYLEKGQRYEKSDGINREPEKGRE